MLAQPGRSEYGGRPRLAGFLAPRPVGPPKDPAVHDVLAVRTSRGIGRDLTLSGFVAAGLAAVLFVAGTYWLTLQQARAQAWISHTHAVLASVAGTRADLAGIQDTQQRFFTSGRDEDLQAYTAIRSAIVVDVQRLREMTGDNPVQQRNAAE